MTNVRPKRHFWWAVMKRNTKEKKNKKKYSESKKRALFTCFCFTAFLAARHKRQIFPKVPAGPTCVWRGVVMPVPHHVVSPPLNSICCPVKLILLQSNKWQSPCLSLTASLALPPFCKLYAAFCSPPCSLLREASATITAAMTKGRICNRIGPVLYGGLRRFHRLTAWLAGGTGGVDHEQRGRSGQRVALCLLLTMGLVRGRAPLKRTENWGRRWRKRRRESVDSHCYCLKMMQSPAMRHLEQLSGLLATRWTEPGPITPARLWKREHRGERETVRLTVQTVDISDFVPRAECVSPFEQWLIVCSTGQTNGLYLFTWRLNTAQLDSCD